ELDACAVLRLDRPGLAVVDRVLELRARVGGGRGQGSDELRVAVRGAVVVRVHAATDGQRAHHRRDDDEHGDQADGDRDLRRPIAADACGPRTGLRIRIPRVDGDRRGGDRSAAPSAEGDAWGQWGSAAAAEPGLDSHHATLPDRVERGAAARAAPQWGQKSIVGTMWWHSGHCESGPISCATPSERSAWWIT